MVESQINSREWVSRLTFLVVSNQISLHIGLPLSGPYQLVDFGHGRKLESLAGRLVDRPSPAAEHTTPRQPKIWKDAESHFDLESRTWTHHTAWPGDLSLEFVPSPTYRPLVLPVQPTPFGHIGIFPEQADNWRWLMQTATTEPTSMASRRAASTQNRALNLFGYTGVSSLSMARTGMHVAHVDAAKPNVEAAKRLADANGLAEAPIRYLVDDAVAFVQREIRRGNHYHTIVMDPPAYGHGPKSKRTPRRKAAGQPAQRPAKQAQAWRIGRDLPDLVQHALDLITGRSFRMLITGHSAEMDQAEVADMLQRKLSQRRIGRLNPTFESGRMSLTDPAGRKLDAGFFVRCLVTAR